jgi:hypothetical protein
MLQVAAVSGATSLEMPRAKAKSLGKFVMLGRLKDVGLKTDIFQPLD